MIQAFLRKIIYLLFVEVRDWFFAISAFCLLVFLPRFSSSLPLNLFVLVIFIAIYLAAVFHGRRNPKP